MAAIGLPVTPVDPSRLPEPMRDILADWTQRRAEQIEKAQKAK